MMRTRNETGSYKWSDTIEMDLSLSAEVDVQGDWEGDSASCPGSGSHEMAIKAFVLTTAEWVSAERCWRDKVLLRLEPGSPAFDLLDAALREELDDFTRADGRSQ